MKYWFKRNGDLVEGILLLLSFLALVVMWGIAGYMQAVKDYSGEVPTALRVWYIILIVLFLVFYIIGKIVKRYNKKHSKTTIYTHNHAADIIENFENVLYSHDIKVPDECREGDETEGCLYGQTYSDLLDETEICLIEAIKPIDGNYELITDRFE